MSGQDEDTYSAPWVGLVTGNHHDGRIFVPLLVQMTLLAFIIFALASKHRTEFLTVWSNLPDRNNRVNFRPLRHALLFDQATSPVKMAGSQT
jgi:hypothetical protein